MLLFLFFISGEIFYSQGDIHTLKENLNHIKGQEKVDLLLDIGKLFYAQQFNPDSVIYYADIAIINAEKINYSDGVIKGNIYKGAAFTIYPKMDSAIHYYNKALDLAEQLNKADFIADISYKFGNLYQNLSELDKAVDYYLKGIDYFEKLKDYNGIANISIGLSGVYANQNQPEKRLAYTRKAIQAIPKIGNENNFTKVIVYAHASQHYVELIGYDSSYRDTALMLAQDGLILAKDNNFYGRYGSFYNVFSAVYLNTKNYQKSIAYCDSAFLYKKFLSPSLKVIIYSRLSQTYRLIGNLEKSKQYLDSASKFIPAHDIYLKRITTEKKYHLNKSLGNYQEALMVYEEFKKIDDTISNLEQNKHLNELEKKYHQYKNERIISDLNAKNKEINKNNFYLLIGVSVIVLLLIVLVLLFRQYRLKARFRDLQQQMDLNKLRMNPHFFFNSLSTIQTYVLTEKEPLKVASYLSQYASIMRHTLESTFDENITIQEEVDYLTNYLEIQKLVLNNEFEYEITLDSEVDESFKIPVMLLQPFVENACLHGIGNSDFGKITIEFSIIENHLIVNIIDNGKGIVKEESKRKSRATEITQKRLYLLNSKTAVKSELKIDSSENGTTVTFTLPLIK